MRRRGLALGTGDTVVAGVFVVLPDGFGADAVRGFVVRGALFRWLEFRAGWGRWSDCVLGADAFSGERSAGVRCSWVRGAGVRRSGAG